MRRLSAIPERSDAGFAIVEVLLAVMITAVVLVPLLAWIITSMRAEVTTREVSAHTNAVNELRAAVLRDIPGAREIAVNPTDPGSCGSAVGSVLVLATIGDGSATPTRRLAYVLGAEDPAWRAGGRQLIRVICDGVTTVSMGVAVSPVFEPPGGWSRVARCVGAQCRSVELTISGPGSDSTTTITAARRLGSW